MLPSLLNADPIWHICQIDLFSAKKYNYSILVRFLSHYWAFYALCYMLCTLSLHTRSVVPVSSPSKPSKANKKSLNFIRDKNHLFFKNAPDARFTNKSGLKGSLWSALGKWVHHDPLYCLFYYIKHVTINIQGVPDGLMFWGLNGLKWKIWRKQTSIKIQFHLFQVSL